MLAYQLDALFSCNATSKGSHHPPVLKNSVVPAWSDSSNAVDPVYTVRTRLDPLLNLVTVVWADSGDAISVLYAGTRALKSV